MQFQDYFVGSLRVSPGLVLSPMSGVTNSAFRRLVRSLNPGALGLVISEFISVEGLTRGSKRSIEMMRYRESERPVGIQIFGYDVQRMCDAARMVQDSGVDLVDINCGCPAPKVVKNGGGCELMRQPEHLARILRAVRKAVSIPLSVKIRSGWDEGSLNALEVARIAEAEGVQALAVHGRTRAQLYRGQADWDIVAAIAANLKIPVLGSGDIVDFRSASQRMQSGVKGLFVGRAAMARPWVFSDIIKRGSTVQAASLQTELIKVLNLYIEYLLEDFRPEHCVGRVKQLASQMCRGQPWATRICRVNTLAEQVQILKEVGEEIGSCQQGHCESALNVAC